MVIQKINIDLGKFRGQRSSILTGRPQGYLAREDLKLDKLDKDPNTEIVLEIPEDTTSFNPSFYLGLLFDSYKKLGLDGFNKKYSFNIQTEDESTKRVLQKNLQDAARSAFNSLSNKKLFSLA
jgi:hypothetical protein